MDLFGALWAPPQNKGVWGKVKVNEEARDKGLEEMVGKGDRLVGHRGPSYARRQGRSVAEWGGSGMRTGGWWVAEDSYLCYVPQAGTGSSQPPCTVHSRADA